MEVFKVWKTNKSLFKKIIWGFILIYFIPSGIYLLKFGDNDWASKPDAWGQYGDFIGGITNPLLTLINIFVLIYLTFTLNDIEESRKNEALDNEKKLLNDNIQAQKLITITQMRSSAVLELSKSLSSMGTNVSLNGIITNILNSYGQVGAFHTHNDYLFSELFTNDFNTKYHLPFRKSMEKIINTKGQNRMAGLWF